MEIELRKLTRFFGGKPALRGLDLVVPEGKVVCIVGASGAGKSVTLKHIVGLLRPDSGQVLIEGRDITRLRESDLYEVRRRFGMIFQDGGLLKSLTVAQNVGLAMKEHRLFPPNEIDRIVAEKLAMVGLRGIENEMPDTLSGGMRKRVSIARALTTNPEAILYDEPTAGLDPPLASQIDRMIRDLNRKIGVTSVVVTHDMLSVFEIADYVYMIHEGSILEAGEPEAFRRSQAPRVVEFLERDRLRV